MKTLQPMLMIKARAARARKAKARARESPIPLALEMVAQKMVSPLGELRGTVKEIHNKLQPQVETIEKEKV